MARIVGIDHVALEVADDAAAWVLSPFTGYARG